MGGHWILLTVTGFILAGIVFFVFWWLYRRVSVTASKFYYRYHPLPSHRHSSSRQPPPPAPRSYSPSRRKFGLLPSFFQRSGFLKPDVESNASDAVYELVNPNRDD